MFVVSKLVQSVALTQNPSTLLHTETDRTSELHASLQPATGHKQARSKPVCFLPGTGLEGGTGRELRVQDRGGVGIINAEHLYLQG